MAEMAVENLELQDLHQVVVLEVQHLDMLLDMEVMAVQEMILEAVVVDGMVDMEVLLQKEEAVVVLVMFIHQIQLQIIQAVVY